MPKRTDNNQASIVSALRRLGCEWIPTSGDPKIGFDGVLCFRSCQYIVEIKNGDLSPSRRQLTDTEKKRKAQVESVGVKYNVIETLDEALVMIGVRG